MSAPSPIRDQLAAAMARVRKASDIAPKVGLVLGSGLGALADTFEARTTVAYEEIPGMPGSRVVGHAGQLVLGRLAGTPTVAMQGRVHLYEGHDPAEVVFGARLLGALGAETLLITNAAGGLGEGLRVGDLMLIEDHLNLTGKNCLLGPNDDTLGPRFVDMTTAYDASLRELARNTANAQGMTLKQGVYAGLLGPTYETPAEIRMLRTLGADAVGMSTVLETIAARHMGKRVLGISCITNLAAGLGEGTLSHAEVKETADRVQGTFVRLVTGIVSELA